MDIGGHQPGDVVKATGSNLALLGTPPAAPRGEMLAGAGVNLQHTQTSGGLYTNDKSRLYVSKSPRHFKSLISISWGLFVS